jgi:hypothetical protein
MSFGGIFDYTAYKAWTANVIVHNSGYVAHLDAQIDHYNTMVGHDSIVTNAIADLQQQRQFFSDRANNAQSVLTGMEEVEAIITSDKTTLYDFWQIVGETKDTYMKRMVFNTGNIIASGNAIVLDGNLTANDATMLGLQVCDGIPINPDVLSFTFAGFTPETEVSIYLPY